MDYAGNCNLESYLNTISAVEISDVKSLRSALHVYPAMLNLRRRILVLNNIATIFRLDLHFSNATAAGNNILTAGLKIIDLGKTAPGKNQERRRLSS